MALPHTRSPMKGRLLQTHTQVVATPTSASPLSAAGCYSATVAPAASPASPANKRGSGSPMVTSTATKDGQFMGAEIMFRSTVIGQVEGLVRDPVSQRVRRLITSYGPGRRRVGVPMEWVVKRSAERLVLGVGVRSLDDLADWTPA